MKAKTLRIILLSAGLLCTGTILIISFVSATTVIEYSQGSAHLQDDHVNDVFIYDTTSEQSNADLGFDANWVHGIAKTTGDPTVNPSSSITLTGTQSVISHSLHISITIGGTTGAADFRTSFDGGDNWSVSTYKTNSTSLDLMVDAIDTGIDVTFMDGASWTDGDEFTIASWWGEGQSDTRSAAQDFPAQVAIIATGVVAPAYTGGVEIIDLSDNTVWMRFEITPKDTTAALQNIVAGPVYSLAALQGKIYLGGDEGNMLGVEIMDLKTDKVWFIDDSPGWDWVGNIAQRNEGEETDAGWVQVPEGTYPSLNTNVVHDLDATVDSTDNMDKVYLAIATEDKVHLLVDSQQVFYNTRGNCQGSIEAVTLVGDDLYWANGDHLCARYDVADIAGTGSWFPVVEYTDTTNPELISTSVMALTGRAEASPLKIGSNIVYIATDSGLTILHEEQNIVTNGETRHYGHLNSLNVNLDYNVLAGGTDMVSDVDADPDHNLVYVATNNGIGSGAVSVLRPYLHPGDTPYLYEYYRTDTAPGILSNQISALTHGCDLVVGFDTSGANRLIGVPVPTETPTQTVLPTGTPTPSSTPSPTPSTSVTATSTSSATQTSTPTDSSTPSPTETATSTQTLTPTPDEPFLTIYLPLVLQNQ